MDEYNEEFLEEDEEYEEPVETFDEEDEIEETKEERKARKQKEKQEKRERRAKKKARFRPLKNFLWWFLGVFSGIIILASGVLVCVGVIPLGTYVGKDNDAFSEDVSNKSLLNIILGLDQYKVSDFKILQDAVNGLIEGGGIDEFITLDTEKLGQLQFVYNDGRTFGSEIQGCIKISEKLLGDDIKALGIFDYEIVPDSDVPPDDLAGTTYNAKLYYYDASPAKSVEPVNPKPAYVDGVRVEESKGRQLYFVALDDLPFNEMKDLIGDRMGCLKLNNVLTALGNNMTDSEIGEILGDVTVNGIGTFDFGTIKLSVLLSTTDSKNDTIYEVLCSATGVADKTALTVGDLTNGFNLDDVSLSVVGIEAGSDIYDILAKAVSLPAGESLTIGHLTDGITFDAVPLSTILPTTDSKNDTIYEILCSATGVADKTALTVGDLTKGFVLDNVSLSVVGIEAGSDIYDILAKAVSLPDGDELTIGHLTGGITFDNVPLDILLPIENTKNDKIYEILCNALADKDGKVPAKADLTVGHLTGGGFNINNIPLTVVGIAEDSMVYDILLQAAGKEKGDKLTLENITGGIEINDVLLSTVLPTKDDKDQPINQDVYEVLCQAVGGEVTSETITIGHLTGGITLDNIDVKSLVEETSSNKILFDVLRDLAGVDVTDTTAPIYLSALNGADPNAIKLSSVLGEGGGSLLDILAEAVRDKSDNAVAKANLTIGHLNGTSGSFDLGNITLTRVGLSENSTIYKILLQASTVAQGDVLSVKHITASAFDIGKISLDTVGFDTTSDIYVILQQMSGKTELTLNDITEGTLTIGNVQLTKVGFDEDSSIYKILLQAATVPSGETLSIKHITDASFDIGKISLENVGFDTTSDIYVILQQMSGKTALTLNDITEGTLTMGNIQLEKVGFTKDSSLYKMLCQAAKKDESATLTLADITGSGFSINNVKLNSVLPIETNANLYKIICDLTDLTDKQSITVNDLGKINDLSKIKLTSVLANDDKTQKLYEILSAVTKQEAGEITLGSLSGNTFDIGGVRISTVVDPSYVSNNDILKALLAKDTDEDPITINSIGTAVNDLELSVLHSEAIFAKESTEEKPATGADYTKVTVTANSNGKVQNYFVLTTPNGESGIELPANGSNDGTYTYAVESGYKIADHASIWLFMLFDYTVDMLGQPLVNQHDLDGNALIYSEKHLTIGEINEDIEGVSPAVMNAKLMQLVDAGVITGVNEEKVLKMTILELIGFVEENADRLPL